MNWDEIRKEFEKTDISLKSLADKYGVKDSTLRSRKNREKWKRNAATQRKIKRNDDATEAKNKHPMIGNRNAVGNRGNPNPTPKFAKRNTVAVKHGLFSKYLPQETLDIIQEIETKSTADMIWDQIVIQYTAIIRAQRIMFVSDKEDITRELKREKFTDTGSETEYEIQFAWDKHAAFLNAQSRAMSELRSLIKQFDEIAHIEDERRLKLEQMTVGIQKSKAEVEQMTAGETDDKFEIIIKRKGEDE
jgi:uncharacterized protein YjcR